MKAATPLIFIRDSYKSYYERITTNILVYKEGLNMTIIVDKEGWVVKIVK